jgi:hypothetical protein
MRRRISTDATRSFVVALALACSSTIFMWPVLSRPGSGVYIGASVGDAPWMRYLANDEPAMATTPSGWGAFGLVDTLRGIYTLAWWAHSFSESSSTESFPGYDANVLYPMRASLTYADLQLGVVPWFAPVWFATRNPVLAYQLAQLAGVFGCAVGFYVLLRSWTGSTSAGLLAGLASIVAPFRVGSASLLYLHFLVYLPLSLLCVDAICTGRWRWVAAIVLVSCLVLQAASSGYLAFLTFLLVPAYVLGVLLEEGRPMRLGAAGLLLFIGLTAALAVTCLYRPFAENAAGGAYSYDVDAGRAGSPVYNPWMSLLWSRPWANVRQHVFGNVGWPLLMLAPFGLLHATCRRRWTLLAITAFGIVLALGPSLYLGPIAIPLPWDWLARIVPGFAIQRQTTLTANLVGVGMICLSGLGAAWLAERARTRRALTLALAALATVAVSIYRWRLPPDHVVSVASGARVPAVYSWLAVHGDGQPLLELPASLHTNAVYAYFSTRHWLPLFNGTYSYPPPGYTAALSAASSIFSSRDHAVAFTREVPVKWILVHGELLPLAERWLLASPPPHLQEVTRFGLDVLYRLRL